MKKNSIFARARFFMRRDHGKIRAGEECWKNRLFFAYPTLNNNRWTLMWPENQSGLKRGLIATMPQTPWLGRNVAKT